MLAVVFLFHTVPTSVNSVNCFDPSGSVNEDVFAYSNRLGDERALVIYHNRFASAQGWIRSSVA